MTKPMAYLMSVAGADGVFVPLSSASATDTDVALLNEMNRIAKAFTVGGFLGSVTFQIATNNGDLCWTCNVTFTSDVPEGIWNNTNHHVREK